VRVTEQLVRTAWTRSCSSAFHDPALFALLESDGKPYVLTWGVDPMRGIRRSASTIAPRRSR
jgi:hypothetical protein